MSFKENTYQQMLFTDSFSGLTAREQKALEKSQAKIFAHIVCLNVHRYISHINMQLAYPYENKIGQDFGCYIYGMLDHGLNNNLQIQYQ